MAIKRNAGGTTKSTKAKTAKAVVAKKATAKKSAKVVGVKPVKAAPVKKAEAPVKKIAAKKTVAKVVATKEAPKEVVKAAPKEVSKAAPKAEVAVETKAVKTVKKVAPAPTPKIEVSNLPKSRVKELLVSQPKPVETEKNPYFELSKKHHVHVNFRQFIKVEGLSAQEFRLQRIDILEHGAVILTSKLAVDHYFRMCNEMRVTVPESMKYFCINEQTAYYLQKYIQYRKRKIFFGHGTIRDLVDVIKKNRTEKFLLPVSDVHKEQIAEFLDEVKIVFTRAVLYKTVAADLSDIKSLAQYDILVFFTPIGIRSLKANFPNFKQGATRIAAFGHATAQMIQSLGYRLDIFAPTPENPSMTSALDAYIKDANKK